MAAAALQGVSWKGLPLGRVSVCFTGGKYHVRQFVAGHLCAAIGVGQSLKMVVQLI